MESLIREHWLGLTFTGLTGAGLGSLTVMLLRLGDQLRRIRQSMQRFNRQLPAPAEANVDATGAMRLVAPAKQPPPAPLNDNERIAEDGYLERQRSDGSWMSIRYVGKTE